jgi:ketosteroid isomerase-like protein
MSHKDVILAYFRAVDERDFSKFVDIFHQEVVYERPGYATLAGLNALIAFYRYERILSSGCHTIEEVVVEEERGACWGRFIGTTKDGKSVDERFADVFTFQDGRIKTRVTFFYKPSV